MSKRAYLIFGDDEYLVSAKAKALLSRLIPEGQEAWVQETVDGAADTVDAAREAIGQCEAALESLGLFGGERVIWLRDASFLSTSGPGGSENVRGRVGDLAARVKAGLPDGICLVVTSPSVDKRSAFYKAFKANGELHEFSVPDKAYQAERQARERVRELSEKLGLKLGGREEEAILERVGTDTRQLANELEKLAVYLGKEARVTREAIDAVVCSSRTAIAWDLLDAFGEGDLKRAIAVMRQLLFQKESPIGIIMQVQSRIRDLLIYREGMDQGWLRVGGGGRAEAQWGSVPADAQRLFGELSKDPRKAHPFYAGKLAAQARRFRMSRLRRCQRVALEAHHQLVSSSQGPGMILEMALIRMMA
jgi:DNA polymerase-3 subunit delta